MIAFFWRKRVLVFLALMTPGLLHAQTLIKQVSVEDDGEHWLLNVEFNTPVSYIKHFPRSRGKILQMQIKLLDEKISETDVRKRETANPVGDQKQIFRDVIYEGNVRGGPYLVVRFPEVSDFIPGKETESKLISVRLVKRKLVAESEKDGAGGSSELSEIEKQMLEGKTALTRGEVVNAILLFTQLLAKPQHKYTQEAREFLGLARERNGQLELAKKEYEAYLQLYGKTSRAKTVEQRLRSLEARMAAPKEQLKLGKRQKRQQQGKKFKVDQFFGSWYQLALMDVQKVADNTDASAVLVSFLNLNKRVKEERREWRAAVQIQSQLEREWGKESSSTLSGQVPKEVQVRAAYAEYRDKKRGWYTSAGRQSSKGAGVLQRFDGVVGTYRLHKKTEAKLVAGAPVEFSTFSTSQLLPTPKYGDFKPMMGAAIEFDELKPGWKSSIYFNRQQVDGLADGLTDRSAVGGDIRYFQTKKTFFALADYDTQFSILNFLTLHYGWKASEKTRIDLHFDHRFSPILLASNSLIGLPGAKAGEPNLDGITQTDLDWLKANPTMAAMRTVVSDASILQRALDNTARSSLVTAGMSYKFKPDLQWNNNVAFSVYRPGAAADELDDNEETSLLGEGLNYSLSSQLIWRNKFQKGDMLMGGGQLSHNQSNNRISLYGIYRGKLKEKWYADGRMRGILSTNTTQTQRDLQLIPSMKVEYRWRKKVSFEFEGGLDYTFGMAEAAVDTIRPFVNAGYRVLF